MRGSHGRLTSLMVRCSIVKRGVRAGVSAYWLVAFTTEQTPSRICAQRQASRVRGSASRCVDSPALDGAHIVHGPSGSAAGCRTTILADFLGAVEAAVRLGQLAHYVGHHGKPLPVSPAGS